MQQQVELSSVERPFERVRSLKELAQLDGDAHGARHGHRSFADDFGQVPSAQVLHRDEEVRVVGAMLIDDRDVSALAAEFFLEGGSPALGFEHLLAIAIGLDRHELECDLPVGQCVGGEEHGRHASTPDLLVDLVTPNAMEDRSHR